MSADVDATIVFSRERSPAARCASESLVAVALVRCDVGGAIALADCDRAAARRRPHRGGTGFGGAAGLPRGSSGVSVAATSVLQAQSGSAQLALPGLLMMRRILVTGMSRTGKSSALERLQLLMRSSRSRSVSKTRSVGISMFSTSAGIVCALGISPGRLAGGGRGVAGGRLMAAR